MLYLIKNPLQSSGKNNTETAKPDLLDLFRSQSICFWIICIFRLDTVSEEHPFFPSPPQSLFIPDNRNECFNYKIFEERIIINYFDLYSA